MAAVLCPAHLFWDFCYSGSLRFLMQLANFKKMMGLQNFLNRAEFLSQHSKDYFQILEILYVCNTFVEIGDLCFVLFFNDEDRGCVLFCA